MPIYEYQCTGCNHHFDLIQKINEEPVKICPYCSESKVIRLVSAAGFQLKGSGWYATDFKTKGTANAKDNVKTESEKVSANDQSTSKPAEVAKTSTTAGSDKE